MKKQLLIINNISYPVVDSLADEFQKRGEYDVCEWIASGRKKGEWNYEPPAGRKITYLSSIHMSFPLGGNRFHLYFNPGSFFSLFFLNPSVIILCGWDLPIYWSAYVYAKIFRKKVIIWSGSTRHEKNIFRTLLSSPVGFLARNADGVVGFGKRSKEYLSDLKVPERKIHLGYYACENDFLSVASSVREAHTKLKSNHKIKKNPVFLYVGQLIERKGLDTLIRAFSMIDGKATLLIAGTGEEEDTLKKLISKRRIKNVFFLGFVDRKNLPRTYALADVFVLPSREEVWGLVVNEAMTCGLPVIVSNTSGCSADLVEDGENGFTFKRGDEVELAGKMKYFIDNPAKIIQMGEESKNIIREYTVRRIADAFMKAFGSKID